MSKRRTERLLSIVVLLLSARRFLTSDEIRQAVIGYPEQDEAFKRMFERDKDELRELGVPLETRPASLMDEEPGYRIARQDYELPEIRLTAEEAAVLGIAARVWRSAELSGAAVGAMLKLTAGGLTADASDEGLARPVGIEPRLTTQEPAFGPLWEAVRDRRPVSFAYRGAGRTNATRRELEPWGVVNRRGRWYVAGHDHAASRERHGARRRGRPRTGQGLGQRPRPRGSATGDATAPRWGGPWAAPVGDQRRPGPRRPRLGHRDEPVHRREVVRRVRGLVRRGRRGDRPAGPAG